MIVADVDPPLFRQLLGRFTTGVLVLTARDRAGAPHGMTANSLASVSLTPPLVSVCVDHAAGMHDLLLDAAEFAVNVLAEPQETLSRRFAGGDESRFDGVGYRLSERGLVLLDGALAHIECARFAAHPAGDHTILVGRVIGGATADGRPLVYFRGGYTTLG